MSFAVQQIGVTGPSARIGGSSEYHIDTKFSDQYSFEQIRDKFDALATRYGQDGRKIEFSNNGVASRVYDLNDSPEARLSLIQQAAAAHNHSDNPGWHSFDYYAPNADKDRWDASAEGAPIYVVGADGLKVEGGTGGGYGNYAVVLDANGRVVSKSGHGDNSQSVFKGGTLSLDGSTPTAPIEQAVERAKNYSDMSKSELNTEYDRLRTESPATAAAEGMRMHKAYFRKT